jgi:HSP20 family molecular chaperone IbpA
MLRTYWMADVDLFQGLAVLEEWMDEMVREVLVQQVAQQGVGPAVTPGSRTFAPPVDVFEDSERMVVKVEVPGLSEKDFDLRLEGNILTI